MVQKVVYNSCYGGFGFREKIIEWVRENQEELKKQYNDADVENLVEATLKGEMYDDGSGPKTTDGVSRFEIERGNHLLADIVDGETDYSGMINTRHSSLRVAEVPDGVEWVIDEYDGVETVKEKTRSFS